MDPHKQLDLILIGKSGNGKSATGCSILRQSWFFKHSHDTMSITKSPQIATTNFQGRVIQVVDCPGTLDTDLDNTCGEDIVKEALRQAFLANPRGFHAFLIVVKYGIRFTEEEQKSIDVFKNILGEDFIKTHGIVVMSNGDTFDYDKSGENITFKYFCKTQKEPFKKLLKECDYRVVLFNNMPSNDSIKEKQVENLIKVVDKLKRNGRCYTKDDFENAAKVRHNMSIESTEPVIKKRMLDTQEIILKGLRKVKNIKKLKEQLNHLMSLLKKSNDLLKETEKTDNEIDLFNTFFNNIKATNQHIKRRIDVLQMELMPVDNKMRTYNNRDQSTSDVNITLGTKSNFPGRSINSYQNKSKCWSESVIIDKIETFENLYSSEPSFKSNQIRDKFMSVTANLDKIETCTKSEVSASQNKSHKKQNQSIAAPNSTSNINILVDLNSPECSSRYYEIENPLKNANCNNNMIASWTETDASIQEFKSHQRPISLRSVLKKNLVKIKRCLSQPSDASVEVFESQQGLCPCKSALKKPTKIKPEFSQHSDASIEVFESQQSHRPSKSVLKKSTKIKPEFSRHSDASIEVLESQQSHRPSKSVLKKSTKIKPEFSRHSDASIEVLESQQSHCPSKSVFKKSTKIKPEFSQHSDASVEGLESQQSHRPSKKSHKKSSKIKQDFLERLFTSGQSTLEPAGINYSTKFDSKPDLSKMVAMSPISEKKKRTSTMASKDSNLITKAFIGNALQIQIPLFVVPLLKNTLESFYNVKALQNATYVKKHYAEVDENDFSKFNKEIDTLEQQFKDIKRNAERINFNKPLLQVKSTGEKLIDSFSDGF